MTQKLTTAQAVIQYLQVQRTARDGHEQDFFPDALAFSVTATQPA
jgi:TPP-dependent trihydroxycyclohexane-1,2-dione (THcHDO) dehydratase